MPVTRYYPVLNGLPSEGPSVEQSAAFPQGQQLSPSGVTYSKLDTAKTTFSNIGPTTAFATTTTAGRQTAFLGYGWYSLGAQTIAAGTWTFSVQAYESNTAVNGYISCSIYVWRESNSSVVGYIYDGAAQLGTEFIVSGSAAARIVSVSGSSVTAQNGDVLIFELWFTALTTSTMSYNSVAYLGAATSQPDVSADNSSGAVSSWIDAPDTLIPFTNVISGTGSAQIGISTGDLFSDTFNRANGTIGSNYSTVSGFNAMAVQSNGIRSSSASSLSAVSTLVKTFGADQEASLTYTAVNSFDYVGPAVRLSASGGTGYVFSADGFATGEGGLRRISGGTSTVIGAAVTVSAGDRITLRAVGTSLIVLKNGVQQYSVTDATYSSGQPGVYGRWDNIGSTYGDDFSATSLATASAGTIAVAGTGTSTLLVGTNGTGTVPLLPIGSGAATFILSTTASGTVVWPVRTGTGSPVVVVTTTASGTVTWAPTGGAGSVTLIAATTGTGTVSVSGAAASVLMAVGISATGYGRVISVLTPDGLVSNSAWTVVGAASLHAALAAGDADYIQVATAGATARVTLSDPTRPYATVTAVTVRVRAKGV